MLTVFYVIKPITQGDTQKIMAHFYFFITPCGNDFALRLLLSPGLVSCGGVVSKRGVVSHVKCGSHMIRSLGRMRMI